MNNTELKKRIKELELEVSNLKSGKVSTGKSTIKAATQGNKSQDENVDKFLSLANNIPSYIAYINADTLHYEFVNDLYVKSFGIPREKIIGSHIKDVIGEENFRFALKFIKEVKSGKVVSYENTFDIATGKRWLKITYTPVFDDKSKVVGIALVGNDITERKQTEKALIDSEERFSLVIDASEQGIWDWNVETREVFYSEQWKKQIGYKDHELKNDFNTWVEHLHPDESEYCQSAVNSYLRQPVEHFMLEFRFRHKDGTYRWIHNKASCIKNNEGKVIRMFGAHTDITKSKQAEKELNDSKKMLELVMNCIPQFIFWKDRNCVYLGCNENFAHVAGVKSANEIAGKTDYDFSWKKEEADFFVECDKRVMDNGIAEYHIIEPQLQADGKQAWLDTNKVPVFDETGLVIGILGTYEDITERRQTEQKLLRSEYELKKAQQITHIGSWYLDMATNEVKWTEELYKMYGFNPELPPPPYTEHMKLFTPESWELLSSSLAKTAETGVPYELELQTVRKDGSNGWMWVRGEAQTDSKGKIIGLWGAAQDISERKEREEQLKDALEMATEADRLKSAFLTNMSHEIRTPMNGILGFAELLKEPHLTLEEQQDFIQTIQISGKRMLNTINGIVDISKIESGLMKVDINETNINENIEFTYKFFEPEVENKGLKFTFKNGLPSNKAIIKTDNEKVYGILTNLIKNAIKFTYEGSIEFGYVLKSDSEVVERSRNAELQFFVKDTGVGIPDYQKELIFERFRQGSDSYDRKYEGSGLGLSIAKSYVEMLGGRIWVESQEGRGTTFYFTIPYNPVSEEITTVEDPVSEVHKEVQIKKLKILIVEDDEISYSLLTRVIQKISKEVIHAITGIEAVEACRNNPDIDLVLMDIRMPQMNGLEATQQIRQFNKDVIIIAQTAYGFSTDCEKALEAGCNDYISKPINKTLLFELIKKHCIK